MKKNLFVAFGLSVALYSCAPRVVYVDRPATPQPAANNTPPPPANNDNQVYTPPPAPAPVNNTQQYNGNGGQPMNDYQYNNNGGQPMTNNQNNSNGGQPMTNYQNNNSQNYTQESDQTYYANQQQVNYGSPSYQTFYDELSPYGSWVNYQSYGYVWVPAQGPGFTPYATNGYWVYTQYGMTWQSNYNWGWAPFHYGSWTLDPFYGWLWIPGHTWAPAWVTWGHYNGYYGWAPIGPGVTYYDGYRPPANHWTFVDERHIAEHNVNNYVVTHDNNYAVYSDNVNNVVMVNHSGTYNNAVYNAGPQRAEIETATGHPMQTYNVSETAKPIPANQANQNNTISVFRPSISQATATNAAPKKVVPIENIKPAAQRGTQPSQNNSATPATHTQVAPAVRPIEATPSNNSNQVHGVPVQNHPVESPVPSQPIQERKPEPVQRNPNPTPTTNPNRPVAPRPQPQTPPRPKPQPKTAAPKPQYEKR